MLYTDGLLNSKIDNNALCSVFSNASLVEWILYLDIEV